MYLFKYEPWWFGFVILMMFGSLIVVGVASIAEAGRKVETKEGTVPRSHLTWYGLFIIGFSIGSMTHPWGGIVFICVSIILALLKLFLTQPGKGILTKAIKDLVSNPLAHLKRLLPQVRLPTIPTFAQIGQKIGEFRHNFMTGLKMVVKSEDKEE